MSMLYAYENNMERDLFFRICDRTSIHIRRKLLGSHRIRY